MCHFTHCFIQAPIRHGTNSQSKTSYTKASLKNSDISISETRAQRRTYSNVGTDIPASNRVGAGGARRRSQVSLVNLVCPLSDLVLVLLEINKNI